MLYEIWEARSRNIVASFPTSHEALDFLHTSLMQHGPRYVFSLVLATEDDDGNTEVLADGRGLVRLARRRTVIACNCNNCNPSSRRAPGWGAQQSPVAAKPVMAPDVLKTAHDVLKQEEAQEGLKQEKQLADFIQQEEELAEAQLVSLNKPASPRLLDMLQRITTAPPPGVCQACGSETASTRSYCVGCVSLAHGLQGLAKAYPVSWNAFLQTAAKDDRS